MEERVGLRISQYMHHYHIDFDDETLIVTISNADGKVYGLLLHRIVPAL